MAAAWYRCRQKLILEDVLAEGRDAVDPERDVVAATNRKDELNGGAATCRVCSMDMAGGH